MPREFNQLIRQEYLKRKTKNPQYSMRAFANWLGVNPSTVSRILNGTQGVSASLLETVVAKLGLPGDEISKYHAQRARSKNAVEKKVFLSTETFLKVNQHHHYAILNLLSVEGFKPEFVELKYAVCSGHCYLLLLRKLDDLRETCDIHKL